MVWYGMVWLQLMTLLVAELKVLAHISFHCTEEEDETYQSCIG
jgi:hypothetical protein